MIRLEGELLFEGVQMKFRCEVFWQEVRKRVLRDLAFFVSGGWFRYFDRGR